MGSSCESGSKMPEQVVHTFHGIRLSFGNDVFHFVPEPLTSTCSTTPNSKINYGTSFSIDSQPDPRF